MATDLPPPSYNEATRQHASVGGDFTFVDFLPSLTEQDLFSAKYEPFSALIDRANIWLTSHRTLEVKTCESVEFKKSSGIPNYERMNFLEHGERSTVYIRGLRLWMVPRTDQYRPCQKIGYMNLVPNVRESAVFVSPTYETLNEVLERFNKTAAVTLPGRIFAIESQEMKVPTSSSFDPDRSTWVEHGSRSMHFLFVIRIFFEFGENAEEEIGVADFVPVMLESGGMFSFPKFEPFSIVMSRASQWCQQQQSLRFCNAQSLEIKIKSTYTIDTQKMGYTEHGERETRYVRVLRVAYARVAQFVQHAVFNSAPVLHLTCKTFIPYQLTTGMFSPEFESLSKTKERMITWMRLTGARVLSAETVALRLSAGGMRTFGVEDSFTFNPADASEHWLYLLRVYLDGYYADPPPHMMQAPPMVQDGCCNII